uniref:N-acetyl-D-glucosamine kinase n=1 Tax=Syphacia muris TaxID=451379 RepID=A0A0N5ARG5_9BILA
MSNVHWKHVWESSEVLGKFISANSSVFCGARALELGAGATGIPSLLAVKCGAKHVTITDHPDCVQGLDWASEESIETCLKDLTELDFIFAADVFYDSSVFEPVVGALSRIFQRFPDALCVFAYEERDSDWNIEDLLIVNNLCCSRVRLVDTARHTIHIGTIYTQSALIMSSKLFGGIEGGATHSKLVIIDENGNQLGEWRNRGTNYYLEGYKQVASLIGTWIREVKKELNIAAPLAALGIGTSGAEDETINERLRLLLKEQHGDVASEYFVGSDSIVTIAATFAQGGVILISGTGSTCRLLKADGTVHGVGGWGHMFSDRGSGFWIANRMFRYIFDDEDGLNEAPASTDVAKRLLLQHFNLTNVIGVLDLLYSKFEKAYVASYTKVLATEGHDDPLVRIVFKEAGYCLGEHLTAISKHFDEAMFDAVPVVVVGSVFKSWDLLRDGFVEALRSKTTKIRSVVIHQLKQSPAVGAAIIAAKKVNRTIHLKSTSSVFDVISL